MCLIDITGSMQLGTALDDKTPRCDTVREAIGIIVSILTAADSQGSREEDGGGLRTITFAGGKGSDIGDINPQNIKNKWSQIEFSGGTWIMPGWRKMKQVFEEEFGELPASERPQLMALVITDGEAEDTEDFASAMAREAKDNVTVCLAIIGFGEEHDRAMIAYETIAKKNANVKVIPFNSETDPNKIAKALLKMVE